LAAPGTVLAAPEFNTDANQVPWRTPQVMVGIVAVIAAVVLALAALVPLSGRLLPEGYSAAVVAWAGTHILGGVILAVVWLLALRRYRLPLSVLGIRSSSLSPARTGGLTVAVLAASLGFTVVYGLVAEQLGQDRQDYSGIIFPGLLAIFTYQAIAVVTPITEELFFRGFVFAGLRSSLGTRRGVVFSGLIFSLFHINPVEWGVVIPIFVTGMLFAWLYQRTGSLWPCIAAHAGQNALAITVTLMQGLDKV
jgi:hypothetical protein